MKIRYFEDSDMLYIRFFDRPATNSHEVAPGIVFDYDSDNMVVGIEVEDGAQLADLSQLDVSGFPFVRLGDYGSGKVGEPRLAALGPLLVGARRGNLAIIGKGCI